MLRLLYFIPLWIGYLFLIKIPVNLLGLVMTLFTYPLRNTPYDKTPKYLRFWINKEDWVGGVVDTLHPVWNADSESLPKWWIKREGKGWKSHWLYHAWRNGGDGLRNSIGGASVDPDRVEYITKDYMTDYSPQEMRKRGMKRSSYLVWQGLKAGFKITWIHDVPKGMSPKHTVLKVGYRLLPRHAALSDAQVAADPFLQMRSFATKFLFKHEDQT